jgi:rhamnosyltransferase
MKASTNNTCAIIITYNPDNFFLKRLEKIKNQVGFVVIVDNNSEYSLLEKIQKVDKRRIELIENNSNYGIAKALNQGIAKAEQLGYKWLVTFDQDSIVEKNIVQSMHQINQCINNKLSIIGSNYINTNKEGVYYHCKKENIVYAERKTVITSGMFFHINLIHKIGGFNNSYFIDSVDHEFCLRARSNNVKVYISCNILMKHSIGETKSHSDKLKRLVFTHSADRVYYMSRNTLVTIKKYFSKEPTWCICQLVRLSIEFLVILLRKERGIKGLSFVKGLRDALLNRMGHI